MTGDSNEEVLLTFELLREWSADALDGLSTGSVLDLIRGLGPREKFCVPSSWATLDGCELGNKVKLDLAGEVARRCGIGGGAGALRNPYAMSVTSYVTIDQ